ncbi:MAG: putative membrane protein, partial [Myxococcota bacterium]
ERGQVTIAAAMGYAALALVGVAWMWADEGAGLVLLVLSGMTWAAFAGLPFGLAAVKREPGVLLWSASALAGVAFFLPMYLGWRDGIGDVLLGALPLLLGAGALVGVGWRVRDEAPDGDLPLALYAGATLMFASLVLPLQVEREWLTIGWSLEVAGLAWLSLRLRHPLIPVTAGILALMVCSLLLLNPAALDYHSLDGPVLFNWILYTWGVPSAALLYAARPLQQRYPALSVSLLLGGVALLFALINLEVAHAFAEGGQLSFWSEDLFEEMTRSISWAAFGIALLLAGLAGSNRLLRVLAFLFLLLSAGKVFLIDLWSLSGLARVGSIMGLGVFLLFAALLFQRVVLREEKDSGESS